MRQSDLKSYNMQPSLRSLSSTNASQRLTRHGAPNITPVIFLGQSRVHTKELRDVRSSDCLWGCT